MRVDPETMEVVERIRVKGVPTDVAVGGGGVWVSHGSADNVNRLDAGSGEIQDELRAGADPVGLAVGGGAVWVANRSGRSITRIG